MPTIIETPRKTHVAEYAIGETVVHRMDPGREGMVMGIIVRPTGVMYLVVWPDLEEVQHYGIELEGVEG